MAEGQQLASKWGCTFVESSSKYDHNTDLVFKLLLDAIDKAHDPHVNSSCWNRCIERVLCLSLDDGSESSKQIATVSSLLLLCLAQAIGAICGGAFGAAAGNEVSTDTLILLFALKPLGYVLCRMMKGCPFSHVALAWPLSWLCSWEFMVFGNRTWTT